MKKTNCHIHGEQGIGLVCTHVAHAIDRGSKVGFYWGDDQDLSRPDAWRDECNKKLTQLNGGSSENWFIEGGFKVLCATCWD